MKCVKIKKVTFAVNYYAALMRIIAFVACKDGSHERKNTPFL
jgi:hypothetical protein